jgi:prepilin-type processing-associated H-X9-DG protein
LDHNGRAQFIDHWYIGSQEGNHSEISEALSTTAALINAWKDPSIFVDERELCFGSRHMGGAQVVFADGHADFISETIDREAWSKLGTRGEGDVANE